MAADEPVALTGAVVTPGGIEAFEGGNVGLKVATRGDMLMCGRLPACASLSSLFSHCITCRSSAATTFAGALARCTVLEGQRGSGRSTSPLLLDNLLIRAKQLLGLEKLVLAPCVSLFSALLVRLELGSLGA